MTQLNVFSQVNAHQPRFVDREINANGRQRSPHVTRALSHSVSIQWHLIGVRKRACAELKNAIRWAAASVGRDRKLKVVRVVLRSLAGDYVFAGRIKLLVMLWLTGRRVHRILHGRRKMRLKLDIWDRKEKRDFINA
jgi:hypothetical protein